MRFVFAKLIQPWYLLPVQNLFLDLLYSYAHAIGTHTQNYKFSGKWVEDVSERKIVNYSPQLYTKVVALGNEGGKWREVPDSTLCAR